MAQWPDLALLHAAAHGKNRPAFEAFLDRYEARVTGFVRVRVSDPHQAQDLTQEIFLKIFAALRRGQGPQPSADSEPHHAGPWLFTLARHAIIDHYRKHARQRRVSAPPRSPTSDPSDAPQARLLRQEAYDQALAAVQALPEPSRECTSLRLLAGLSYRQIATVTGENENTVRSRVNRALIALQTQLREPNEVSP